VSNARQASIKWPGANEILAKSPWRDFFGPLMPSLGVTFVSDANRKIFYTWLMIHKSSERAAEHGLLSENHKRNAPPIDIELRPSLAAHPSPRESQPER
jgi:hypothetical protein